jgi:hypothetical protein
MNDATAATASGERFGSAAVRGWDRFWFRPADPSVLGIVRILIGLIGLYVHFGYTYDLMEFVGPEGWINKATIDQFRHEYPIYPRRSDWSDAPGMDFTPRLDSQLTQEEREYAKRWDGNSDRFAIFKGYNAWSIYYHVTDPFWIQFVHACVLLTFLLLTIGLGTRVVSVLAWLATLSYIQRHYVAFFGMDTILSFMTLYLMIGPSGAAMSVDRLIARYARAWRALRAKASARKAGALPTEAVRRAEGLELDPPRPMVSANFALRLIQVHVAIVYLASGTSKLMGAAWWNGTALWGTMVNPEFSPVQSALYMDAIHFLCRHRWLWELFTSGGAAFTLAFEIGFIFLVWNRWTRWVMIASAVALHTGIAFFMGLTTFSLIMIAAVFSFTPPDAVERVLRWLMRGRSLFHLAYDPKDRRQVRAAAMVRAVDVWNQVRLVDHATVEREAREALNGHDSEAVTATPPPSGASSGPLRLTCDDHDGEALSGYSIFERLARSVPMMRPLGALTYVPGFAALGRARFPGSGAEKNMGIAQTRKEKSEKVTR